jgi:hypothetical protein
VGIYVEIVGLQKLQIQSASLVAIGANPLDFLANLSVRAINLPCKQRF